MSIVDIRLERRPLTTPAVKTLGDPVDPGHVVATVGRVMARVVDPFTPVA